MKRFNAKADARVADDAGARSTLMCQADRCPRRWSTSPEIGEGARGLCTSHARTDPALWPRVTDELLEQMAEDAYRASVAPSAPTAPMPKADRQRLIAELRKLRTPDEQGPRDWAHRLKAREDAGERLTPAQRECYRAALRSHLDQAEPA